MKYKINEDRTAIKCMSCLLTSWNQYDLITKYCDNCKTFYGRTLTDIVKDIIEAKLEDEEEFIDKLVTRRMSKPKQFEQE
jgi:hypothetical protein